MTKQASQNQREDSLIKQAQQEGLTIPKGVNNGKWDRKDEQLLQRLLNEDRRDGQKTIRVASNGTIVDSSSRDDKKPLNSRSSNSDLTQGDKETAFRAVNKYYRNPSQYSLEGFEKRKDGAIRVYFHSKATNQRYYADVVNGKVRD